MVVYLGSRAVTPVVKVYEPPAQAEPKDVNFYDYDGAIVASWTLSELATATELPPNPSHPGLTAQGWNWSLADLKSAGVAMNVGQMYVTDDGKTRLYIRIAARGRMTVPLYFGQSVAHGVSIDWGDGSTAETVAGTVYVNTSHAYGDIGNYCISLAVAEGCELWLGSNTTDYCIMGSTETNNRACCNMLKKAEIGRGVVGIGSYAFYNCYGITSFTVPNNILRGGVYQFNYCYSLSNVTLPDSLTVIGNSMFIGCYSLINLAISPWVTSISNYAFRYCCNLTKVTIPPRVTNIGTYVFNSCYGVVEYHLLPATPPALAATNAFGGIPDDCIIYVPQGSLAAYQGATNWATYASYMREE